MNNKCALSFCGSDRLQCEFLCGRHNLDFIGSPIESIDDFIAAKEKEESGWQATLAPTSKQNEGKPRYSLVEWEFVEAIADCMTWGLTKYPAKNYLGLDADVLFDSMMRHLAAHRRGEKNDSESGKPHLHHFVTNAMMYFAVCKKEQGK